MYAQKSLFVIEIVLLGCVIYENISTSLSNVHYKIIFKSVIYVMLFQQALTETSIKNRNISYVKAQCEKL